MLQQLYGYIYVEYPSQFASLCLILDIFGICTLQTDSGAQEKLGINSRWSYKNTQRLPAMYWLL